MALVTASSSLCPAPAHCPTDVILHRVAPFLSLIDLIGVVHTSRGFHTLLLMTPSVWERRRFTSFPPRASPQLANDGSMSASTPALSLLSMVHELHLPVTACPINFNDLAHCPLLRRVILTAKQSKLFHEPMEHPQRCHDLSSLIHLRSLTLGLSGAATKEAFTFITTIPSLRYLHFNWAEFDGGDELWAEEWRRCQVRWVGGEQCERKTED